MQIMRLLVWFFCMTPLYAHQWTNISYFDLQDLGMYTALNIQGLNIAVYYNKNQKKYFGNKASEVNFMQGHFDQISAEEAQLLFASLESVYQKEKKEREDYFKKHYWH